MIPLTCLTGRPIARPKAAYPETTDRLKVHHRDKIEHPLDGIFRLQTTTTATTLLPGGIGRGRGDVLDSPDPHSSTCKGAEGGLGTGAWGLGSVATGGTDLDVQSVDSDFLAAGSNVLRGKHSSVRR